MFPKTHQAVQTNYYTTPTSGNLNKVRPIGRLHLCMANKYIDTVINFKGHVIHLLPFISSFMPVSCFVYPEFKRDGFGENKCFEAVIVENKNS